MILNCVYLYLTLVMAFSMCYRDYERHEWRTKYA